MKTIKTFAQINEADTLFGSTTVDRLPKIKDWADENKWKNHATTAAGEKDMPREVRDILNQPNEKGVRKYTGITVAGNFNDTIKTFGDIVKAATNILIGKEKGWETSGIKMIDNSYYDKSKYKAVSLVNPALGSFVIEVKPRNMKNSALSRRNDDYDFTLFIYALNDTTVNSGNITAELKAKVEEMMTGTSKADKISIIRYIKDKYTDYSDSI